MITLLQYRVLLPLVTLIALTGTIFILQPRTMSYFGLSLLFSFILPIALATVAQMFVIAVNEIDLSIGAYVSFATVTVVTYLDTDPAIAVGLLLGAIALHTAVGALIQLFQMPSIVITLGMSFFWGGCALMVRPLPGGHAPDWLTAIVKVKTPFVPFPILACVVLALLLHLLLMRSAVGTIFRGTGGNERAIRNAGLSVTGIKSAMFFLSGLFGVLSGVVLAGLIVSADADIASNYTLLSIAAVILGGGLFVGGIVSPTGAVIGAATLTLAASFLSFINVPADWQTGAQGAILIIALALRGITERYEH